MTASQNSEATPPERGVLALALVLYAVGLLVRIWPFVDAPLLFLERFPTEDGYFMLTIGRNLAIGKGFTTANGTIPTNGTQPLTTLLWTVCFWFAGGDRNTGVALVLLLELALSIAATYALWRLGLLVLRGRRNAASIALLGSAVWFASPMVVTHTMNCLETGAYALTVILCAHAFTRLEASENAELGWGSVVGFGALLGITFWTRNDAVFLIAAACATHVGLGFTQGWPERRARLLRAVVFGSVSVLVAAPWLAHNYFGFGSIVPVSGRAEQLTHQGGGNMLTALTTLVEYADMVLPIPQVVQNDARLASVAALLLLGLTIWVFREARRARHHERAVLALIVGFGALLTLYYGVFFGARWFVQRYLFPISPFFGLLFALIALRVAQALGPKQRWLVVAGSVAIVGVVVSLQVRTAVLYRHHPHFQVVRWVKEHVPDDVWVGAVQTGTLGFYHDRTLNFDGKVNPFAYQAIIENRRAEYVLTTPVKYLVDWAGIADWLTDKPIRDNFDLLIRDDAQQLGVLVRKSH